jgi:mono/diheme cytochrome c family protein
MKLKSTPNRIAAIAGVFFLFASTIFGQNDAKALYLDRCSVCHGPNGQGKTAKGRKLKVKSVKDTIASEDEAAMIKIVNEGKGDMDSFKKQLTPDQVKAVVEYYRGLAH